MYKSKPACLPPQTLHAREQELQVLHGQPAGRRAQAADAVANPTCLPPQTLHAREQELQVLHGQPAGRRAQAADAVAERGLRHGALALLQLQDLVLHRACARTGAGFAQGAYSEQLPTTSSCGQVTPRQACALLAVLLIKAF